ncbi:HNH endonuclease signature motif containing protein [Lapillicoccus jejuensis]|uniref:Uncharacterized protein DUF222 n=1 Tax=Lapillicoccus jejuensis TaxID=402171 RepID=A0A542E4T1_9MICO|nr:HNH endonuclease signature motif containing protein [Lapillicoccus jejuensis]TQJ10353.1 uncharacterized protein DUF222 [Lapillicoccus jejuensis]
MTGWRGTMEQVGDGLRSPLGVVPDLESLTDTALVDLEVDEALAVVELVRRATSALDAIQVLALEAFARRTVEEVEQDKADLRARGRCALGPEGDDVAAVELATALRLGRRAVSALLDDARMLARDLPQTLGLVRAGRLDLARARVVAHQAFEVAREHRPAYDDAVVHPELVSTRYRLGPTDLDVPALRKRVAAAAAHVDPESQQRRAESARRDAFVRVGPGLDPGMSTWSASLPSEDSLSVWAAIDELAGEYLRADPSLTVGPARAQALVSLVLGRATITTTVDLTVPLDAWPAAGDGMADGDGVAAESSEDDASTACTSDVHGDRRPALRLVPDLTWSVAERGLAGLVEVAEGDCDLQVVPTVPGADRDASPPDERWSAASRAQESPGSWSIGVQHPMVGFVLAEAVARLLADPDTRVRLHGCHPRTGALLTHDPTTYRPAAAVARAVRARDGHCRFPGCSVPAARTQLDHVVPFPTGPTTVDNLACLCVTHHRFKTHTPWTYVLTTDGICTWTSPLGRTYATEPAALRERAA